MISDILSLIKYMHVPLYTVQYMCGRAVIGIPGSTEVMTDTHYPVALCYDAVADPGFSRGDAPTPKLGLFCKFFVENCMKMKEFGRGGGGARPWRPLGSANAMVSFWPSTVTALHSVVQPLVLLSS